MMNLCNEDIDLEILTWLSFLFFFFLDFYGFGSLILMYYYMDLGAIRS